MTMAVASICAVAHRRRAEESASLEATSSVNSVMTSKQFRIESDVSFTNRLLPPTLVPEEYGSWDVAVAVAVKCVTQPGGHELRLVHCESGEVVFRTESPE
jgi:hypothetical protein